MRHFATARLPLPRAAIAGLSSLALLSGLALTGCGSSSGSSGSSGTASNASVTATGAFGQQPDVKIPKEKAGSQLAVKTLISGTGPVLTSTESLVGDYAVYIWSGTSHRLAQSTFGKAPALFSGRLLPGLETALRGKKIHSRVLAVIPPKEGYGTSGNTQGGVKGTDTLVFVIDMIQAFPANASASGQNVSSGGHGLPTVKATTGSAPTITVPKTKPPASLVAQTLVKGSGPAVSSGQTVVVQYTGVIWRTGKVFDSSWSRSQPFGFTIDASPAQVISGWNTGLTGKTVGSRVMLVIPPKDGYGSQGSSEAGIKGTDTLVFVVDVLGAFS